MTIIVFAPHNDDEVLGCGGTIAKLSAQGDSVIICEVTAGDLNDPTVLKQKKEAIASHKILGVKDTIFLDLPVVGLKELPTVSLNDSFLDVVKKINPDVAFIPFKGDMHIDHRMVVEAAMVALRPVSAKKLTAIYAYETLSETGWNVPSCDNAFIPNVFVDISDFLDLKIEAMKCHRTQLCDYPHPRSLDAIQSLAMYRGSCVCRKYAEAFMCIRKIL